MPKKKRAPETPEVQFGRFVDTARSLDIPEDDDQLENAFSGMKPKASHGERRLPKPGKQPR